MRVKWREFSILIIFISAYFLFNSSRDFWGSFAPFRLLQIRWIIFLGVSKREILAAATLLHRSLTRSIVCHATSMARCSALSLAWGGEKKNIPGSVWFMNKMCDHRKCHQCWIEPDRFVFPSILCWFQRQCRGEFWRTANSRTPRGVRISVINIVNVIESVDKMEIKRGIDS